MPPADVPAGQPRAGRDQGGFPAGGRGAARSASGIRSSPAFSGLRRPGQRLAGPQGVPDGLQVCQERAGRAVAGVRVRRERLLHQAVQGGRDAGVDITGRGDAGRRPPAAAPRSASHTALRQGRRCPRLRSRAAGELGREVGGAARLVRAGGDDRAVGEVGGLDLPLGAEKDMAGPQVAVATPARWAATSASATAWAMSVATARVKGAMRRMRS